MNEYLVSQLKKGRLDKGLKQSDVAKETGIKNTTLSNYENGVTEPDMDTFLALCELYELDFVSLMEEAYGIKVPGKNFHIKPSQMEMLKRYDDLDDHGKVMVDFTLENEYERSVAEKKKADNVVPMTVNETSNYEVNAAHAIPSASEEDQKHDEDIMDDENF
jgi:transcriptional regulator with XRE-family HTH domain